MRFLKTLAVFIVLFALTVCAAGAEEFVAYTKAELEAMKITLPEGLAVTDVQYSDGLVQIYVDSAATRWDYIAAQSTSWGGAKLRIGAPISEDVQGLRPLLGGNEVGSANMAANLTGALVNMWSFLGGTSMDQSEWYGRTVNVSDSITSYSAETNTVTPIDYSGDRALMFMNAMYATYEDDRSILYGGPKYALIELIYTDSSSVKVEDVNVPSNRIALDAAAQGTDSYKSSGVAAYQLKAGNTIRTLVTTVTAPANAAEVSCEGEYLDITDGKISIAVYDIGSDNYYTSVVKNLLWYNADGDVIDAERVVVSVQVGDPVAWPNYIAGAFPDANLTKANVNAYFTKDGSRVNPAFMNAVYNAGNGTVTVSANDSIASVKEDMTAYRLRVELTPPAGAVYGTSYGTVTPNALGTNPNGYALDGIWEDQNWLMGDVANAKPGDEAYVEIVNGRAYFDDVLFNETRYRNDPGLTVYVDANLTDKATLTMQMIDWRDADGEVIGRQWFAVQYQPMAYTAKKEVVTQAPADADSPVLVAKGAAQGYTLCAQSYPQVSETGTQIHYELQLLDANGSPVSLKELGADAQVLLPYQTEGGMADKTMLYTIRHYNANGKLQESAAEQGAAIVVERVEGGVLMNVKSLSPFVMSWNHQHDLVYTASGNTFTETCSSPSCDHKATWTLEVDSTVVSGSTIESKSIKSANWLGGDLAFSITDAQGNSYEKMPTEPGVYTLKASVGNAELVFTFTVIAQPSLPATGDNSLPLWMLMVVAMLSMVCGLALYRKARRA